MRLLRIRASRRTVLRSTRRSRWSAAQVLLILVVVGSMTLPTVLATQETPTMPPEAPTDTPVPPPPTETPVPLSTDTPIPIPTETPVPLPTETAIPPTDTPVLPSETPAPPTATVAPTPIPTSPPVLSAAEVLTFGPAADARVEGNNPDANFGVDPALGADNFPDLIESYLRFDVGGVTGAVTSATLRIFATNGSPDGPKIFPTGTSWTEAGITWNTKPVLTGGVIADVGAVGVNVWVEYDVTALVVANGAYGFALVPDSGNGVDLASREAAANRPELVLVVDPGGVPGPTPPPPPTVAPTEIPTSTATPIATSTPGGSGSQSIIVAAAADARVESAAPAANFGTQVGLEVDGNPAMESYLRFDVGGLNGAVTSATLRLFNTDRSPDGPKLYPTGTNWTEAAITWNTKPAPTGGVLADVGEIGTNVWIEYDVTALVVGNGAYGFALVPDSNNGVLFSSREAAANNPQLVIATNSGGPPPPTATNTPVPTPGPTSTLTPTATASPVPTITNTPIPTATASPVPTITNTPTPGGGPQTLRFGAAADARVAISNPTTNFGADLALVADLSPAEESYLRFDVGGLNGAVTSAKLRLYVTNSSSDGPKIFPTGTGWTEAGITWNTKPGLTGGAIADLGAVGVNVWVEYDVTALVGWNGAYGFAVIPDSDNGADFRSRENAANPPELLVTVDPTLPPPPTPTPSPIPTPSPTAPPTPTPIPGSSVVLMAAGDIACGPENSPSSSTCRQMATSDLLLVGNPDAVAVLGDVQYECGELADFNNFFHPSWGRVKPKLRPAIGNHEYDTVNECAGAPAGAPGYWAYFGGATANPLNPSCTVDCQGYYSYDLGSWHIVVLNSNCSDVPGGCGSTSPQAQWLRADLAAHPNSCTLAYWHHPLYSSAGLSTSSVRPLYQVLYDHGAEIVLAGHAHNYERFAPQDANGNANAALGIRQFVVGTGGFSHLGIGSGIRNSEVRNSSAFGVLKLTLTSTGYSWQFVPITGQTFGDSGSGNCH